MPKKDKNPHAVALGKLGGPARAKRLSAKRRSAIAKKAGQARTKKVSAAERQRIARKAALARWAAQRQKQA